MKVPPLVYVTDELVVDIYRLAFGSIFNNHLLLCHNLFENPRNQLLDVDMLLDDWKELFDNYLYPL